MQSKVSTTVYIDDQKQLKHFMFFHSFRFSTEALRKLHVDRIHGERSHEFKGEICEYCAKSFRTKTDVMGHVRRVHGKSQKFKCDICDAWLTNRYTLKTHMLNHSADPIKCPHCDKMSPNSGALNQHIQKFHLQQPIHKCNLCGKSFKELTSLRVNSLNILFKLNVPTLNVNFIFSIYFFYCS